jgi:hypothetical protein
MARRVILIIFIFFSYNFFFSQTDTVKPDAVTSATDKIPDYFKPDSSLSEPEKKATDVKKEEKKPEDKKNAEIIKDEKDAVKKEEDKIKQEIPERIKPDTEKVDNIDSVTRASDAVPEDELSYILNMAEIKEQRQKDLEIIRRFLREDRASLIILG